MLSALGGLAAGAAHVLSGPDHLTALAPLAVSDQGRALKTGAMWGVGHGTGVLILGLIGQSLKGAVDIHLLSSWSEFLVGFLLIGMGAWAMRTAWNLDPHHPEADHGHGHSHSHANGHVHSHSHSHGSGSAALAVGVLHGAAGGGHLFGVLPSLALPADQAAIYLACYLLAAIVTMSGFGYTLGLAASRGGPRVLRGLMLASAFAAIAVGAFWLVASFPHA